LPKQTKTKPSAAPAAPSRAPAAAKLIAAAKARQFTAAPPELAELREVLAYNDTVPFRARVSAEDAIDMLAKHGWTCTTRAGLDSMCRRVLGRKTYGTKS
jgi:hypothetical protein